VFTARYALSPYIKQIRFVFKGLKVQRYGCAPYRQCGSRGKTPLVLNHDTIWKRAVSFAPRPLYLRGRRRQYPWNRRLCGTPNHRGRFGEEKNSLLLPSSPLGITRKCIQICVAPIKSFYGTLCRTKFK
jgi:hypothetical protein